MRIVMLAVASVLGNGKGPVAAQVPFSPDAVEEIQSLTVRVDVAGAADGGRLARLLEDVLRQELVRADILFERSDPQGGDGAALNESLRFATRQLAGDFVDLYRERLPRR